MTLSRRTVPDRVARGKRCSHALSPRLIRMPNRRVNDITGVSAAQPVGLSLRLHLAGQRQYLTELFIHVTSFNKCSRFMKKDAAAVPTLEINKLEEKFFPPPFIVGGASVIAPNVPSFSSSRIFMLLPKLVSQKFRSVCACISSLIRINPPPGKLAPSVPFK